MANVKVKKNTEWWKDGILVKQWEIGTLGLNKK
jgi:hypothetical protein